LAGYEALPAVRATCQETFRASRRGGEGRKGRAGEIGREKCVAPGAQATLGEAEIDGSAYFAVPRLAPAGDHALWVPVMGAHRARLPCQPADANHILTFGHQMGRLLVSYF
jgi:hypothetical protein